MSSPTSTLTRPGDPGRPPAAPAGSAATMRKVSLRNLAAHKVRLLLTILSVVLGTAFVTGSFIFTDTLGHTFHGLFANVAKGADVQVTGADDRGSGVPIAARDRTRAVPAVV